VSGREIARRSSYGPNSPVVGERGARTRSQIVDAAHELFERQGFGATSVDHIARASGVSRATLYQYFASKDHLFVELVDRSGEELNRRVEKLGALSPTAQGYENLRWWLQQWGAVLDAHRTVFVEWANVTPSWAPVQPRLATFLERHARHLTGRVRETGFRDVSPSVLAVLFIAVVERSLYIRHVHGLPPDTTMLVDGLAVAFQLTLFPDTPEEILPSAPANRRPTAPGRITRARRAPSPVGQRFDGLPPQSQRTIRGLLDAGADVFADRGYAATNVGHIIARAGTARATFYKYFDGKLDLFATLSEEVVAEFDDVCSEAPGVDVAETNHDALHRWLLKILAFKRRRSGVFRAWTERVPAEPAIAATARAAALLASDATRHLRAGVAGAPTIDDAPAAVMIMALLEHFPDRASGTRLQPPDDEIVAAEELFIRRSLLRPRSSVLRSSPS
jgi:AcrR family transcriptional regulator